MRRPYRSGAGAAGGSSLPVACSLVDRIRSGEGTEQTGGAAIGDRSCHQEFGFRSTSP